MPFVEPTDDDQVFIRIALEEARRGYAEGGVPVGSVLVENGRLVAQGHNRRVQESDPMAHGEMDCLRRAGRRPHYRSTILYTTLSPCMMCSGAILLYGIPRVVVGENRTFMGEEDLLRSRGVEVVLVDDARCVGLMRQFIEANPGLWNEDIGE